jgi:hypothetical protein
MASAAGQSATELQLVQEQVRLSEESATRQSCPARAGCASCGRASCSPSSLLAATPRLSPRWTWTTTTTISARVQASRSATTEEPQALDRRPQVPGTCRGTVPRHRAAHDCAPDRRPALRYLLLHDAAAPADLRCSREQPRRSRSRELGRAGGGHTFNMTIAHAGRNASTASADTDSGPTTLGGDYKMLKQLAGQITAATLP